ncbi:methylglutaconyl-CoA hydratase [Nitritalea halalkaliphila LW7]|uniref:Methylglutaconyl-CoA hydratase n=1 Tax=Nitritalea halalkaliphila LW7 TaxID=1189621 RepID=I5BYB5_9BACT|nr:enoyl-CoA hydratase-related protein [Nitritalea halalkaliphila]EIM74567.1 methylglutaconyl-CoA hydratase [Nitritalea halalkaliphila LW7]
MKDAIVQVEIRDRIGFITLNRPEKRNALNAEMVQAIDQALTLCEEEAEAKVIVLRAAGKAFCSGADLASLQQMQTNTYEENLADSALLKALFERIYTYPKVIIAAVQGHALAGGCGLAAVCDFSFAVPEALFGYTEVRIGFVPAIVMVFLVKKIGEGAARKLLLGAELIDAHAAQAVGMIGEVVPAEELMERVESFAQLLISQNSGTAMALTKKMLAEVQHLPIGEALQHAAEVNAHARGTEDCKKGIAAFLAKEKPLW